MKLALGTVQFGMPYGVANKTGQVALNEARDILKLASENGIDMLDTAIAYGNSEQRLGEIGIQGWQVVSKLPAVPKECENIAQWAWQSVEKSLKNLRVDSLHGLLLHRPQQLLEKEGGRLYDALALLKQQGKVSKIGVSIYAPSELDAIFSSYQIDLVQGPFNLLDRRMIETGWLARLASEGTEFHARSLFLQGLLLMDKRDRPAKFQRWDAIWTIWHDWLKESRLSPVQACLRYVLEFTEINRVIVGVDSQAQLREIVAAIEGRCPPLPADFECGDLDLINPAHWASIE